jgi:hypothetical protein
MHGYGFNDKMEDPPPFFVRRWAPAVNKARLKSVHFKLAIAWGFRGIRLKENRNYVFYLHFFVFICHVLLSEFSCNCNKVCSVSSCEFFALNIVTTSFICNIFSSLFYLANAVFLVVFLHWTINSFAKFMNMYYYPLKVIVFAPIVQRYVFNASKPTVWLTLCI